MWLQTTEINNMTINVQANTTNKTEAFIALGSNDAQTFLRYLMEDSVKDKFEQTLYPQQGHKNKGDVKRESFKILCDYVVNISAKMNILMMALVKENAYGPGTTFQNAMRSSIASLTEESMAMSVKTMIANINSGRSHVILPSKVKPKGYDILYSGLPNSGAGHRPEGFMPFDTATMQGGGRNDRTPGILERLDDVYNVLFGRKLTIADASKRVIHRLPLDTDFAYLDNVLNSVQIRAFGDLTLPPLAKGLKQYMQLLVIKEPNNRVVNGRIQKNKGGNLAPVSNSEFVKDDLDYLLDCNIRFSFVLNLPREWAQFIAQAKDGEQVSLTSLNTWATLWSAAAFRVRSKKMKGIKDTNKVENLNRTARYVLSVSHLNDLVDKRKELGMYTEPGRVNAEGLYVNNQGRFNWCGTSADNSPEVARDYETRLEKALELSFSAGTPLVMGYKGATHEVFELNSPEYAEKIKDTKEAITAFSGQQLMYNWDYNTIVTTNVESPERMTTIDLSGAAMPDELGFVEYLNLSFHKSIEAMYPHSNMETTKSVPNVFVSMFKMYETLAKRELVPSFEKLLAEAMTEMAIKSLEDPKVKDYDSGLYTYIDPLGTSREMVTDDDVALGRLFVTFSEAFKDAHGGSRTKLAKASLRNSFELEDSDHFFDMDSMPFYQIKHVFNYVGGKMAEIAMRYLSKIKPKDLKPSISSTDALPAAKEINSVIMPLAIMCSNYSTNSDTIFAKAEELQIKLQPDESFQPEDLKIPGLRDNFSLFPHQFKAQQVLNNAPRFAFLDVAPGGGKTLSVLTDIANLMGKNLIRRPIIFAPNRLVKNWCDDLLKLSDGKWNVIPILLAQYKNWGEERLAKLIENAPRNTIVVCGMKFLNARKYNVVIGNVAVPVSGATEFIKKFKFDYVASDEAHRVKNPGSFVHKAVKSIATASCVKYVRLATGSIIQNKLTDVVGQAAIMNSQMFKTPKEFEDQNLVVGIDDETGKKTVTWSPDAAKKAREIMASQVAVITAKRKDWAFLLPTPVEHFIPVNLIDKNNPGNDAHSLMYQAVLTEVLDEIKTTRPDIMKALLGKSDDDDSEDEKAEDDVGDDDDDTSNDSDDKDDIFTEDEGKISELTALLDPYIARLERILTDPLGDEFGKKFFEGIEQEDFVSQKVLRIIKVINEHFNVPEWSKGSKYLEWAFVQSKGVVYQLHKEDAIMDAPEYTSVKEPSTDPKWNVRSKGKVLVFCRYTRSVDAIYRALPPNLKSVAVKFTAQEKNGSANIANFVNSDKVQVLIANEQALSEGFNFQMAGRLIRVETPWAPGELDQSISRIFRPDPGGKVGGKNREMIYLDWIVTNQSLEVPKMGRLISKMVSKAQFDEYGNDAYADIQNLSLPMVRMNLDTLKSTDNLTDIVDYTDAYQQLASIQAEEFLQMKKKGASSMLPIAPSPMFNDASTIPFVPYVSDQEVYDRDGLGLKKLSGYIEANRLENNLDKLVGKFAHTEMGNGVIVKVATSSGTNKVRQIQVQLAATGDIYKGDPTVIFIAENLTSQDLNNIKKMTPWATPSDKRRAEKIDAKLERERLRSEKMAAKQTAQIAKVAAKQKAKDDSAEEEDDEETDDADMSGELYPVVYNGFLGLKAFLEEVTLEQYGFKPYGKYAFIDITKMNATQYDSLVTWIDDKFEVPNSLAKPLLKLEDHLLEYKKFKVELTPYTEFRRFYQMNHKLSLKDPKTKKQELKVYPVVTMDKVILKVDLATNPTFAKWVNKPIPGIRQKFDSDDGLEIWFAPNNTRNEVVQKVKELVADGYTIENMEDVKVSTDRLKTYKGGRTK